MQGPTQDAMLSTLTAHWMRTHSTLKGRAEKE
jgi:hypothetical protein